MFDFKQEVHKFIVVRDVDIVIRMMKKFPAFLEPKALFKKSLPEVLAHTSMFFVKILALLSSC
jgi:hypothetical protein